MKLQPSDRVGPDRLKPRRGDTFFVYCSCGGDTPRCCAFVDAMNSYGIPLDELVVTITDIELPHCGLTKRTEATWRAD
jgi:hypothetical protein